MSYPTIVYSDTINLSDCTEKNCPNCNNIFKRETKLVEIRENRNDECPNEMCTYEDKINGKCICEWKKVELLYLTCEKCLVCECKKCNIDIVFKERNSNKVSNDEFYNQICTSCKESEEKEKNGKEWKSKTIEQKLDMHSVARLKLLARRKKIKKYTEHDKEKLIEELTSITTDDDFPIRDDKNTA